MAISSCLPKERQEMLVLKFERDFGKLVMEGNKGGLINKEEYCRKMQKIVKEMGRVASSGYVGGEPGKVLVALLRSIEAYACRYSPV